MQRCQASRALVPVSAVRAPAQLSARPTSSPQPGCLHSLPDTWCPKASPQSSPPASPPSKCQLRRGWEVERGLHLATNCFCPGEKKRIYSRKERGSRREAFLVARGGGRCTQGPGKVWGPPAPAKAPLSPLARGRPGLTPGSVFCSCRALWAFRAESRAQYVRKAHPEEAQGQRDRVGVSPGSSKSPPPSPEE